MNQQISMILIQVICLMRISKDKEQIQQKLLVDQIKNNLLIFYRILILIEKS